MNMKNEDGYELWLRYRFVDNPTRLKQYRDAIQYTCIVGKSKTIEIIRRELAVALRSILGHPITISDCHQKSNSLVIGSIENLKASGISIPQVMYSELEDEGFIIQTHSEDIQSKILITGNTDIAVLTGVFHFLRLIQTQQDIHELNIFSRPKIRHRILAHWDNIDRSIERGYTGKSLWIWDDLPDKIDPRYDDYARACASIGINGVCLNNVNAQPENLAHEYLIKTAALADVFRPYGLRVYLAPVFSAPIQLGNLPTADPRDPVIVSWWQSKVDEIYALIPDFGGFQIKANSEGQPGPKDYSASHDDGANMLARVLEPYGGIVLWRAFVYSTSVDQDRAKCAYKEFVPLDGRFNANVVLQIKNGPIDFQPREPFNPLFGAIAKTPLALELQITQEYLGQSIHLVYLAYLWKEVLDSDTYAKGPDSAVAQIVDGSTFDHNTSVIVGVANTGSDPNWCGHHFSQANWYAFGRLAWDYDLDPEAIADEWIRATWSNDIRIVEVLKTIMIESWPACIKYMAPLGLHHMMAGGHHYGPDPGFNGADREDWNNTYYHRADSHGIGFDRSKTGSDAVSQYNDPLNQLFNHVETCPEKYLLWFHHVPWEHQMESGKTLWEEMQFRFREGVEFVEEMVKIWESIQFKIDQQRYQHVLHRLNQQLKDARLWRDVCIHYFSQFIGQSSR